MVKIKLCGITRMEDYLLAGELGIDYAGFIFVPGSPRCISPGQAGEIIGETDDRQSPLPVGVFADQPASEIRRVCNETGLRVVQLHGSESLSFCSSLGIDFWKVLTSVDELHRYPKSLCSTILLDSSDVERTGASLSRDLAGEAISSGRKLILAGGLGKENIEGFLQLKPWGVDFSSSVEKSPGLKDHKRLRSLVRIIRGFNNDE